MADEVFNALTRWGDLGHAVTLGYGPTIQGDCMTMGWHCIIHHWRQGSVSIGALAAPPSGYHPTSAHEAARIALQQAGERWPETAERTVV